MTRHDAETSPTFNCAHSLLDALEVDLLLLAITRTLTKKPAPAAHQRNGRCLVVLDVSYGNPRRSVDRARHARRQQSRTMLTVLGNARCTLHHVHFTALDFLQGAKVKRLRLSEKIAGVKTFNFRQCIRSVDHGAVVEGWCTCRDA